MSRYPLRAGTCRCLLMMAVVLTVHGQTPQSRRTTELRNAVKGMKGQEAMPDRVELGEGGWAFGSGSMSRAAIVAKGHPYQANMVHMGFESMGDWKDAMVRVLELAIRGCPEVSAARPGRTP